MPALPLHLASWSLDCELVTQPAHMNGHFRCRTVGILMPVRAMYQTLHTKQPSSRHAHIQCLCVCVMWILCLAFDLLLDFACGLFSTVCMLVRGSLFQTCTPEFTVNGIPVQGLHSEHMIFAAAVPSFGSCVLAECVPKALAHPPALYSGQIFPYDIKNAVCMLHGSEHGLSWIGATN